MGLENGKQPVVQLSGCHDLNKADDEFVLKRTAKWHVVYST